MQTVNEARYTFWRTIIEIEQDSGQDKYEWCRENKISIKTFNHYEGIFRRQKARGYIYGKDQKPEEISIIEETALNPVDEEHKESAFVEIPMFKDIPVNLTTESHQKDLNTNNEAEKQNNICTEEEGLVIQVGNCRLSFGKDVQESTLRAVLKAVGGYA